MSSSGSTLDLAPVIAETHTSLSDQPSSQMRVYFPLNISYTACFFWKLKRRERQIGNVRWPLQRSDDFMVFRTSIHEPYGAQPSLSSA